MKKKIVVIGLSGESVFLTCDHFNEVGETIVASSKFIEPGGKGFNQALALGRIGCDVSFITVLGNDNYKDECLKVLEESSVKTYPIYKDVPSSYAVIQTNKEGENNVCVYKGASELVTTLDIMKYLDIIKEADILLLQLEYPFDVIKDVIEFAYQNKVKVVLNPAPAKVLEQDVLDKIYLITPNEFELFAFCKEKFTSIEECIEKVNISRVVCTRGQCDIVIKENNKITKVDVKKVRCIDSTGAGDIFNAFLVSKLDDVPLVKAVEFASCAATLSVLKKGVCQAIPTILEVNEFMDKNDE